MRTAAKLLSYTNWKKKQKKERGAIQIRKEVRISHLFTRPKFLCMIILQKVDF